MAELTVPVDTLLEELRLATGHDFAPGSQHGPWMTNVVVRSGQEVAYLAPDERGRERLRSEAARLQWAAQHGVPVPRVLERDVADRWLVVQRVPDDEVEGPAYVDAAVLAARALAAAPDPPASVGALHGRASSWQNLPVRALRALVGGVGMGEFRTLRAQVAALPDEVTVHGDFHVGNVLSDAGQAVTVVDFEFLGRGPVGTDLADMWPDLVARPDRERLLAAALAEHPDRSEQLLLLVHWSCLRHLADLVTPVPRRQRDQAEVAAARARLAEARVLRRGS